MILARSSWLARSSLACLPVTLALACSDNGSTPVTPLPEEDAGADAGSDAATCGQPPCPGSKIEHLVVIVQENHTFDTYFGRYCTAPTGSSPTCNEGPACCEAAPDKDPGTGGAPTELDDAQNGARDPSHLKACELDEIDGGKMDKFVSSTVCGNAGNFAYAPTAVSAPIVNLAKSGAMADRYFQPIAGQSSSNNMYFARAQWVFDDNVTPTDAMGTSCDPQAKTFGTYDDPTIVDLLAAKGASFAWYAEGYDAMKTAVQKGQCPQAPDACPLGLPTYPCWFDPGDIPVEYYAKWRDKPEVLRDGAAFAKDLGGGTLPAVSFVKGAGFRTEHPGQNTTIKDGMDFVAATVAAVQASPYAASTLILLTYDEGGGFFDHVAPPPANPVDKQPYGTRVPFVAVGPFAKKGFISHVTMEHSSVVKFIEWNWLGGQTGQLKGRDATIANIGSLLDPAATGTPVPEN